MARRMTGTLKPEQVAFATQIGKARHRARGSAIYAVELDVKNACAEHAVSVAFNRKWNGEFEGLSKWKVWKNLDRDVTGLEVKTTSFVLGNLVVEESDADDHVFVLVIDRDSPTFAVVGWLLGADAKKSEYWNTDNSLMPSFHVPQSALKPAYGLRLAPETETVRTRDPAKDFGGKGRFPQRRYADNGSHPSTYGHIITSRFDLPCCRCQQIIPAGQPTGGNLVTGNIHGDPEQCGMKKRRAS
jgi:hypothetical protein